MHVVALPKEQTANKLRLVVPVHILPFLWGGITDRPTTALKSLKIL